MTEVVIATVLLGSAYLLSNQKNKENFEEPIEKPTTLQNRMEPTALHPKHDTLNTSVDKYFDKNVLNGTFTHNNMTPFYKNNSYGNTNYVNDNRLDTYTGSASNHIVKQETSTLFKPQDNLQNVFGNQNQNDFLQSRVNESNRHANSKPWEEIREGPGDLGFNSSMQYRDQTQPKTVDQLRAANNPKSNYHLNYKAPAYKPTQLGELGDQMGKNIIGKMIKKTPDTYHVNEGSGGMGPARGMEQHTQKPLQMMTTENRDDTSVLYYGARGTNTNVYTKGNSEESKKIQLPANPFSNLSSQGVFQVSDHGKDSFKLLDNNRTTKQDYFGNIKGQFMSNVVAPIANQLNKKSNLVEHPNPVGFMATTHLKPIVFNPYAPTTQREMMSETKPHLNFQGQATSYINSNPYMNNTQRQSTSHSIMGGAGGTTQYKSYDAEYNQRNIQKPYENRMANGNMSLYNGTINASINGHEQYNSRPNALYAPSNDTPHIMGQFTKQNQQYELPTIDNSILKAFKENPYTHSLSSVA
jgi:hypothetical protein